MSIIIYLFLVTLCDPSNKTSCNTVVYGNQGYSTAEECMTSVNNAMNAPGGYIMKDPSCIPIIYIPPTPQEKTFDPGKEFQ